MVHYATEDEQLEALKRWWRENGRAVVIGATLGVLALVGWRGWEMYSSRQALTASAVYDEVLEQVGRGDLATVSGHAATLRDEHGDTLYAALGALAAAAVAVREDELDGAAEWLRWVVDNPSHANVAALARARLARLEESRGRPERALELLEAEVPTAYTALYAEIRGDALRALGEDEAAAAAYQKALDAEVGPANPRLVELKRNNVRGGQPAAEESGS